MSKKELFEKLLKELLKEYKEYAIGLDGLVQFDNPNIKSGYRALKRQIDIIIAELETKLSCTDEV